MGNVTMARHRSLSPSTWKRSLCAWLPRSLENRHYACFYILFAQVFERIVFYSIFDNLTYFLQQPSLSWNKETAATNLPTVVIAISWMMGLIGGLISDSFFGRYVIILITYAIYFIGQLWLAMLTGFMTPEHEQLNKYFWPFPHWRNHSQYPSLCAWSKRADYIVGESSKCGGSLLICLIVIGSAGGVLHSALPTFGAEQLREQHIDTKPRFFRYYYFAMNCGGFIAAIPIAFLQQYRAYYSFIVLIGCILVSAAYFYSGTKFYIRRRPQTSTLFKAIKLIAFAAKWKWINRKLPLSRKPPSFLDYGKAEYGGHFGVLMVADVKSLGRVLRVMVIVLVIYFCAYSAVEQSFYLLQGLHMNVGLKMDSDLNPQNKSVRDDRLHALCNNNTIPYRKIILSAGTEVPPTALTVFNAAAILLFLPIIGKIYSTLSRRGLRVSVERRLIAGYFALMLSLLSAALVEFLRLRRLDNCGFYHQVIGKKGYGAVDMSVFYQIPQYALQGIADVLVTVTTLEYVFLESPESMLGVMVGLFWFVAGIGNILTLPITKLVKYIPGVIDNDEINCNREHYFMMMLAGLVFLGVLIIYISSKFCNLNLHREIKAERRLEDEPPIPRVSRRISGQQNASQRSDISSQDTPSIDGDDIDETL